MKEPERILRRSVLDRLLQTGEPEPRAWSESVRALKRSLLRDVEWLLNTRSIARPAPAACAELQHSVYHYGLPDITSLSADSPEVRRQLAREVEQCLHQFEPRLSNVRVTDGGDDSHAGRRLHLVIEGLLQLDPLPEPIVFDTVFETASGRFDVTGGA